ncbi:MAG TPA: glycogen debranching N-terminal domain-containing protein, partial [Terriglobales bacterium]|nr:glycogen debranching N-terminal domain-containing protein [Terriglobales bacterium]
MNFKLPIPVEKLEAIPEQFGVEYPKSAEQEEATRRTENLTLIDGKTFLSTNVAGDIMPPGASDVGFFCHDTRFLSYLELRVNHRHAIVLSSSTDKTFVSQIELSAAKGTLRESFDLPENTIHIRRQQLVSSETFFDRLTFLNFNRSSVHLSVDLFFDADFSDVFEVRGMKRSQHGQFYRPVQEGNCLIFVYRGLDDTLRQTVIEMNPSPTSMGDKSGQWEFDLGPGEQRQIDITVHPVIGETSQGDRASAQFSNCLSVRRERYAKWESKVTHFYSSHGIFDAVLNTAVGDFHALQIEDRQEGIVAAGIPWFATIFGRDSIIASFQALLLDSQLARDTLRVLARYQGKEYDDWRDEEPGKILHEYRQGEMTCAGEMPFSPYYGSIDSTPLFLILLSEVYNWTADETLIRDLLPTAFRALDWIDRYADLDGDGFVEYAKRSPKGLVNQSWKDSWDANMRRDGSLPASPIAPIEVQGYVYDAKFRMSCLLRNFGENARADKLMEEATALAKRLESYWMGDSAYYAIALDNQKKPVKIISSNPGHLLFSRAVPKDKAHSIVKRLMQPDMFSGWGWRTLSEAEPTFNPLSYHRGSVWPHDNSLIAHGMVLNDFREPAIKVMTSLFEAALHFHDYRLPELFCGVQRREQDEPVQYPVSCSPQAWASGTWFLMLTSILGIRPSAAQKELNI